MGTRSLIYFQAKRGDEIVTYVVIYQQFDGYPEGVGQKLAKFILSKRFVNGFGQREVERGDAVNGYDDFIAQFIAQEKNGIGNFYIYPADTKGDFVDFVYNVMYHNGQLTISVNNSDAMDTEAFAKLCGV